MKPKHEPVMRSAIPCSDMAQTSGIAKHICSVPRQSVPERTAAWDGEYIRSKVPTLRASLDSVNARIDVIMSRFGIAYLSHVNSGSVGLGLWYLMTDIKTKPVDVTRRFKTSQSATPLRKLRWGTPTH